MQVQWVQVSHRHLHRQKDTKLYYVISMRAFAEKGKEKIAKGLQKKVARGKTGSEEAGRSYYRQDHNRSYEINVQTAI